MLKASERAPVSTMFTSLQTVLNAVGSRDRRPARYIAVRMWEQGY